MMTSFDTFCVVVYISNFTLGLLGNIFVIIYLHDSLRSLKKSCHFNKRLAYILYNLAIADIFTEIFGIIGVVLEYDLVPHPDGTTGDVLCKVLSTHTLTWSFTNVSVLTVVLLAWERYNTITQFKHNTTTNTNASKYIRYAIGSFWIIGPLAYSPYIPFQSFDPTEGCVEKFPNKWSKCLIALFDFIAFFITPAAFFAFTYTSILLTLKKPPKDLSKRRRIQFAYHKIRKKLTQTIMLIVFGFILCWSGSYTIYVVKTIGSLDSAAINTAYEASLIFAFFASTSHPIIYSFRSREFRKKVKSIWQNVREMNFVTYFSCWCCQCEDKVETSRRPYLTDRRAKEKCEDGAKDDAKLICCRKNGENAEASKRVDVDNIETKQECDENGDN